MRKLIPLFAAATLLAGCYPTEAMREEYAAIQQEQAVQLAATAEDWLSLYNAQDWDALSDLYAEDAVLMAQGNPKIEGREAILAFLQRLSNAGGSAIMRFEPEEVIVDNNLGFVTSKYWMNITLPDGTQRNIAGRSLLAYKWQDGGWKIWRDMDNYSPDVTPDPLPSATE